MAWLQSGVRRIDFVSFHCRLACCGPLVRRGWTLCGCGAPRSSTTAPHSAKKHWDPSFQLICTSKPCFRETDLLW